MPLPVDLQSRRIKWTNIRPVGDAVPAQRPYDSRPTAGGPSKNGPTLAQVWGIKTTPYAGKR